MFSDNIVGEMARAFENADLSRNLTPVSQFFGSIMFVLGGVGMLVDELGYSDGMPTVIVLSVLLCLAMVLFGLLPIRLPVWMYPKWRAEQRRRERLSLPLLDEAEYSRTWDRKSEFPWEVDE